MWIIFSLFQQMDTRIFRVYISVYIYSCCVNIGYFTKIMKHYENCARVILSASSLT